MNNFIMMVGPVGAGKTTFIQDHEKQLIDTYQIDSMLSSDAVIEEVAAFRELTYSEVFRDTIDLANKYVENLIGIRSLEQRSFMLDQTNMTAKSRKRKLGLLIHPQNYVKIAVVLNDVNKDTLINRLEERAKIQNKIIPLHVLDKMLSIYEEPTIAEGFDKVYTVAEFIATLNKEDKPTYGEGVKFA